MAEIVVVGSINLDTVVQVERLPGVGETVTGVGHFQNPGGKGANQAVAAARLGRRVAFVGMVGDDDAGRVLTASLEREGVDLSAMGVDADFPTGMALITVGGGGENTIVVSAGANSALTERHVEAAAPFLSGAGAVLLQLEVPIEAVARAAELAAGLVILNPAPARDLPPRLLDRTDVLVPNETELGVLSRSAPTTDVEVVIGRARAITGPGAVVVTLGERGAVLIEGERAEAIAAPSVAALDSTAAGDAFCGALADALVGGADLADAVHWAATAGAVTVTRPGAQGSLPSRAEVLEVLE